MNKDSMLKGPNFNDAVTLLCDTARRGLIECYSDPTHPFPYTNKSPIEGRPGLKGHSIRYAAISHIGISRWLTHHPKDAEQLPNLHRKIANQIHVINDLGDAALWVWAACEGKANDAARFVLRMKDLWPRQVESCHAVEVAWVVKACVRAHEADTMLRSEILPILEDARRRLAGLFEERSGLFRRHRRPGFGQRFSGEIACFADQVYPIVALSDVAATFGDARAKEMAARTADRICDFQGPLGQWMWHYDVPRNRICEEYPVFSVHQHAMAPMALLAVDAVTGRNHRTAIEKGVCWLWHQNELAMDLVLEREGIIWRDIERREPGKLSRKVKAACCVLGIRPLGHLLCSPFQNFKVNFECRPYELGWILYAWADQVRQWGGKS